MALSHSPRIITNGLVLCLDAANRKSYPTTGTTWTDLSGNGINGTLVNGVGYNVENGGSLSFDNIDAYITLGTPSLLNGVQVPLTICMWAKANSFGGSKTLWGVYRSDPGVGLQLYSLLRVESGVLKYIASDPSSGYQVNGTLTPSENIWNFYVVKVSGTLSSPTVTLYINDSYESISYSSFTSSPDLNIDFRIGANSSDYYQTELWDGNIANVFWYNRALTAAEIEQNYNALKGRYPYVAPPVPPTVLFLSYDIGNISCYDVNNAPSTVYDLSGNSRNASLSGNTGGPVYNSADGGYLTFDGINNSDYIQVSYLFNTRPFSINCWLQFNDLTGTQTFVGTYYDSFSFQKDAFDIVQMVITNDVAGQIYCADSTAVSTGTWYNYCTVVSAADIKLYRNGTLITTTVNSDVMQGNAYPTIGASGASGSYTDFVNANISDVQIYTGSLTESEVTANYDALKSRYGLT